MQNLVASFAEAWIEINIDTSLRPPYSVASFAEAWIEIGTAKVTIVRDDGRLLRGGVD